MPRRLATIETPHPVYGLSWAADGSHFVYGGGYLYGGGFVGRADARGDAVECWSERAFASDVPETADLRAMPPIVANVVLSDSGEYVVLCRSSYKWGCMGPMVLRLPERGRGGEPQCLHEFGERELRRIVGDDGRALFGATVGAWPYGGEILVHHRAWSAEDVCLSFGLPPTVEPAALVVTAARGALHDARIVVIDDVLWLAKRDEERWRMGDGERHETSPAALVAWDLRRAESGPVVVPLPDDATPNTLVRSHDGSALYVAMRDGRVETWTLTGRTSAARSRVFACQPGPNPRPVVVRGVLSLCCLPGDAGVVTAASGGCMQVWTSGLPPARWDLPAPLTPRSVAASPDGRHVAIGCKAREGHERGAVLIYDVS